MNPQRAAFLSQASSYRSDAQLSARAGKLLRKPQKTRPGKTLHDYLEAEPDLKSNPRIQAALDAYYDDLFNGSGLR